MWTWHIKSGKADHNGVYFSSGWSGHNVKDGVQGRNNPGAVQVHDIGPLPPGEYTAGSAYDSPHTGPTTIPLTPKPGTNTFGRSDFKIHGWQIGTDPNDPYNPSSDGCIMQARPNREAINSSPDKDWEVVGE